MKSEDLLKIRATEIAHMLVNLTNEQKELNNKPFSVDWEKNTADLTGFIDNIEDVLKHPRKNQKLIYLLTNLLANYQISNNKEENKMMLKDLNKNQTHQLKERILLEKNEKVSYRELANADSLISDLEVKERFGGINFVPDDFDIEAENDNEIKIKIYPIQGIPFYVILSKIFYDADCMDKWIEKYIKDVDMWEYV